MSEQISSEERINKMNGIGDTDDVVKKDGCKDNSSANLLEKDEDDNNIHWLYVGGMVHVKPRTWPGMNKLGGAARIIAIHTCKKFGATDTTDCDNQNLAKAVDVQYVVMGGRERNVSLEYVVPAPELLGTVVSSDNQNKSKQMSSGNKSLRDRSNLLGRCTRCGSLRADCGSCDWKQQLSSSTSRHKTSNSKNNVVSSKPVRKKTSTSLDFQETASSKQKKSIFDFEHDLTSSSSSDDSDAFFERVKQRQTKLLQQLPSTKKKGRSKTKQIKKRNRTQICLEISSSSDYTEASSTSDISDNDYYHHWDNNSNHDKIFEEEQQVIQDFEHRANTGYNNADYDDDDEHFFIQPEGLAQDLPKDIIDETLPFKNNATQLQQFFNKRRDQIIKIDLPHFNEKFQKEKQQQEEITNNKTMIQYYKSWQAKLIAHGVDQCRLALQRIELHQNNHNNFSVNTDIMDLQLESLEQKVESFMKQIRQYNMHIERSFKYRIDDSQLNNDSQMNVVLDDVIYYDSSDDDHEGYLIETQTTRISDNLSNNGKIDQSIHSLDRHQHASRVRKHIENSAYTRTEKKQKKIARKNQQDNQNRKRNKNPEHNRRNLNTSRNLQRRERCKDLRSTEYNTLDHDSNYDYDFDDDCNGDEHDFRKTIGKDSNALQLENFLFAPSTGQSNKSNMEDKQLSSSIREKQTKSIADRMQSFLDANTYPTADHDSNNYYDHDDSKKMYEGSVQKNRVPSSSRHNHTLGMTNKNVKTKSQQVTRISREHGTANITKRNNYKTMQLSATTVHKSTGERRQNNNGDVAQKYREENHLSTLSANHIFLWHAKINLDHTKLRSRTYSNNVPMVESKNTDTNEILSTEVDAISDDSNYLSDLCCKLVSSYHPENYRQCQLLFHQIYDYVAIQKKSQRWDKSKVSKIIFTSILTLFQNYGKWSIVNCIYDHRDNGEIVNEKCRFHLYMKLVIFTMQMIEHNLHSFIEENVNENNLVYKIFSGAKSNLLTGMFIEMILLQIIDTLYSQMIPEAWGSCPTIPNRWVIELAKLCERIGKIIPIVECVSMLILNKFPCQEWKRSTISPSYSYITSSCSRKKEWFVTSIDPFSLQEFWLNGKPLETTTTKCKIRLMKFQKSIPRREIDTIWSILAFVGRPVLTTPPKSSFRWKLISILFSCDTGVLNSNSSETQNSVISKRISSNSVAPNPDLLSQCANELSYLTNLLFIGSLDPIVDSGNMIIKLIQKSVLLEAEAHAYNQLIVSSRLLQDRVSKVDTNIVKDVWLKSDLLNKNFDNVHKERLIKLFSDPNIPKYQGLFSLSSHSSIINRCSSLLHAWMMRSPNKKARWSRFKDSVNSLVSSFEQQAKRLDMQAVGENQPCGHNTGNSGLMNLEKSVSGESSLFASLIYRDAARCLILSITEARINYVKMIGEPNGLSLGKLNNDIIQRSWNLISDKYLKINQGNKPESTRHSDESRPISSLYCAIDAAKTITFLTIMIFDEYMKHNPSPSLQGNIQDSFSDYDLTFQFAIDCLTSCISSATKCLEFSNANESKTSASDSSRKIECHDSKTCINSITCICYWINLIICRFQNLVDKANEVANTSSHETDNIIFKGGRKNLDLLIPLVSRTLACLVRTVNIDSSQKSSVRILLSLIRNIVKLLHKICKRTSAPSEVSTNILPGELWDIFVIIFDQSKPSQIFLCGDINLHKSNMNSQLLSIQGKSICAKNIGGFCSTFAAMCSLDSPSFSLSDFLRQKFQPCNRYHHLVESQESTSDDTYLRQTAQCLCAEICRLHNFPLCLQVVDKAMENMFIRCIESLVDADTVSLFPTSNIKLVSNIGGQVISDKVNDRLRFANEEARSMRIEDDPDVEGRGIRRRTGDLDDTPGPSYMRKRLWTFCRDLGLSMIKICESSKVEDFENKQFIERVGKVLNENSFIAGTYIRPKVDCSKILEKVPDICLERELVKRLMKLCDIVKVFLLRDSTNGSILERCTSQIACFQTFFFHLTKVLLEQLNDAVLGVKYFDATNGTGDLSKQLDKVENNQLLRRSNAIILQRSLSIFSLAFFTQVLNEHVDQKDSNLAPFANFVKNSIFRPSLDGQGIDLSNDLKQWNDSLSGDGLRFRLNSFPTISCSNLTPKNNGSKSFSVKDDLSYAAKLRMKQIIHQIYSNNGELDQESSTHLVTITNKLFSLGISNEMKKNSNHQFDHIRNVIFPIKEASSMSLLSPHKHDFDMQLEDALNTFFSENCKGKPQRQKDISAVIMFRQFALRQIILPRLNFTVLGRKKKIETLLLLKQFLKFRINNLTCWPQRTLISLCEKDRLFSVSDLCSMVKGISQELRKQLEIGEEMDESIVQFLYDIGKCLMLLNYSDNTNILQWCRKFIHNDLDSSSEKFEESKAKSYLYIFFKWLLEVGTSIKKHKNRFLYHYSRKIHELKYTLKTPDLICNGADASLTVDISLAAAQISIELENHENKIFVDKIKPKVAKNNSYIKTKQILKTQGDSFQSPKSDFFASIDRYVVLFSSRDQN